MNKYQKLLDEYEHVRLLCLRYGDFSPESGQMCGASMWNTRADSTTKALAQFADRAFKALEEAGRCPDCGAGDDNHHSASCKLYPKQEPEEGQFDELIERWDSHLAGWKNTKFGRLIEETIEALHSVNRPKPFDVLEHLLKKGELVNEAGDRVKLMFGEVTYINKAGDIDLLEFLKWDWQPYKEPVLEDGLYWTKEDDKFPYQWYRETHSWEDPVNTYSEHERTVRRHTDGRPMKIEKPSDQREPKGGEK